MPDLGKAIAELKEKYDGSSIDKLADRVADAASKVSEDSPVKALDREVFGGMDKSAVTDAASFIRDLAGRDDLGPEQHTVKSFRGRPMVGRPTVEQVTRAAAVNNDGGDRRGEGLNPEGAKKARRLSTPEVRATRKKLARVNRKVAKSGGGNQRILRALEPAERFPAKLAGKAGKKYDIEPALLMSLMRQESGFNPAAASEADAHGLTQFIPGTAEQYGVKFGTSKKAQKSQVFGAAKKLTNDGFQSDPHAALNAYTGGYGDEAYNNPVLEGAADYRAVNKLGKGNASPKLMARQARLQEKAAELGIVPESKLAAGVSYGKPSRKQKVKLAKEILRTKTQVKGGSGGGKFKISADGLNADQRRFAAIVAKDTGLDPQMVGAWVLAEQGGPPGDEYSRAGYYNFLNITPHELSDPNPEFRKSVDHAAHYTANSIMDNGKGMNMGAGIPDIVPNAVGKSPEEQKQIVLGSGWGTVDMDLGSVKVHQAKGAGGKQPNSEATQRLHELQRIGKDWGIYEKPKKKRTVDWSKPGKAGLVRSADEALPVKELDKWLKPSGSGSGQLENIHNLNPVLARQLVKIAKESGEPITVDSGQRSTEYQNNIDSGTNPKAPGGLSAHQFGMAADTDMTPAQTEIAAKYGVEHGSAGPGVADPPHTELTDPTLIEEAMKYGPIRSGYLPEGLPESVGDITSWEGGGKVTIVPLSLMAQVKANRQMRGGASPAGSSVVPSSGSGAAQIFASAGSGTPVTGRRKKRRESVLGTLRKLGYTVTAEGVSGGASQMRPTIDLAELEKKYS